VPQHRSEYTRVNAPRQEWTFVTTVPALVSQELYDRVQAKLSVNRAFAQRNNTRNNDYLLRDLVSCGVCGLACMGIRNSQGYRCVGKQSPVYSRHEEHCPARLSPAGQLDEVVWKDLCDLLIHPEQIAHALQRAHGGHWLPQEMQSRQQGLRRAHSSLSQQLDRLTEAYLSGVIPLEEYRRRRTDAEQRQQALEEQQRQLDQHTDRQNELAGLAQSIEGFCQRIRQGLKQASFEQKRQLVELLIDRVLVTGTEVEIRYVVPTSPAGEKNHFSHLRSLYRTRSPCFEKTRLAGQRVQSLCQCPTNTGRDRDDAQDSEGAGETSSKERRGGRSQIRGEAIRPRCLAAASPSPSHLPCFMPLQNFATESDSSPNYSALPPNLVTLTIQSLLLICLFLNFATKPLQFPIRGASKLLKSSAMIG